MENIRDLKQKVEEQISSTDVSIDILDVMDYRDQEAINREVNKLSSEELRRYFDDLVEMTWNCIFSEDYTRETRDEIIDSYRGQFEDDDSFELFKDSIEAWPSVSLNTEKLLKSIDVGFRLTLFSNYDCINSHWFEMGGGGYAPEESYFGDVLEVLGINPAELQPITGINEEDEAKWPDIPRDPVVDFNQFWAECENRTCGACLLVATVSLKAWDIINTDKIWAIEVPAGTDIFFFSSFQGGGSLMSMQAIKPMVVELKVLADNDYKPSWELCSDTEYSVTQVYGEVNYSECTITKTPACSYVLQAMDADVPYMNAVKQAVSQFDVKQTDLEEELNIYI